MIVVYFYQIDIKLDQYSAFKRDFPYYLPIGLHKPHVFLHDSSNQER